VKLAIKEKRQEMGEEGHVEMKIHRGNKWWKIMTIYSKDMKTTRRLVEDAVKGNMEDTLGRGLQRENRRKRRERRGGMGKENPKTKWKM
jgi:hypothetical protein